MTTRDCRCPEYRLLNQAMLALRDFVNQPGLNMECPDHRRLYDAVRAFEDYAKEHQAQ